MVWLILTVVVILIISYLIGKWLRSSKNSQENELFLENEHTSSMAKELVFILKEKYNLDSLTVHQLNGLKFHELYIHILRTGILDQDELNSFNNKHKIDPSIFIEENTSDQDYIEDTEDFIEYEHDEKGNAS